ncbi:MAG: ROK family protein [Pseudomonadota bacterium]
MRIGIDLGGTKIEGVLLADDGGEAMRHRMATPATGYESVLDAIAEMVKHLGEATSSGSSRSPAPSVGVATPGFLAPVDGLVRNSNLVVLNGRPVDKDLSKRIGRPVRLANDANCFVLSEVSGGAAARPRDAEQIGDDVVFGATLGTGVGGGLVINERVWAGANGSAAEWSHTTLPFLRPDDGEGSGCFCGREACIESFLCGRGLTWDHQRATGEPLSPVVIGDKARAGDAAAGATFARYEDRLARALASVVNLVDPRAIVLGGGVSNNVRLFTNVPAIWERYTIAKNLTTRLVRAQHGDASGVRGAACLWPG